MRQLVYTMFITNNYISLHLWWKENLVIQQNISKYYEHSCRIQFTPVDWWIGNCWVISICSKVYWYPINKHNKEHTASGFSTKKKLIGQKKKNEIPLPMFRSIQIVIPRTGCRDFQMIACRDPDTEISKRLHTENLVPRFPNRCMLRTCCRDFQMIVHSSSLYWFYVQ